MKRLLGRHRLGWSHGPGNGSFEDLKVVLLLSVTGLRVREPPAGSLKPRPSDDLVTLLGCTTHDKEKKSEALAYRQEFLLFFGAPLQDRHGNVVPPAR